MYLYDNIVAVFQLQWEKRIHKSLNSMCGELGVPLARLRQTTDKEELDEKWTELSTYDIGMHSTLIILFIKSSLIFFFIFFYLVALTFSDLSQYRPVYAPKDFLEVLLLIRSPNYRIME